MPGKAAIRPRFSQGQAFSGSFFAAGSMERLRKRSEFRAVAKGARVTRAGFVLQALKSGGREPRIGFTVTNKIGNAVVRNRIRRRLREAARLAWPKGAAAGTDYVLIGRRAALTLQFERLVTDLTSGFAAINTAARPKTSRIDDR